MNRDFDGHSALINRARLLGTYAHLHGFEGTGFLKGLKVSRIVGIYGKHDADWMWSIIDGVMGKTDRNKLSVIAPAVFVLDLVYRIGDDRGDDAFHLCNSQFLSNCIKCVRLAHGWWSLKRYSLIRMAKGIYAKLEADGGVAWQNRGADTVE